MLIDRGIIKNFCIVALALVSSLPFLRAAEFPEELLDEQTRYSIVRDFTPAFKPTGNAMKDLRACNDVLKKDDPQLMVIGPALATLTAGKYARKKPYGLREGTPEEKLDILETVYNMVRRAPHTNWENYFINTLKTNANRQESAYQQHLLVLFIAARYFTERFNRDFSDKRELPKIANRLVVSPLLGKGRSLQTPYETILGRLNYIDSIARKNPDRFKFKGTSGEGDCIRLHSVVINDKAPDTLKGTLSSITDVLVPRFDEDNQVKAVETPDYRDVNATVRYFNPPDPQGLKLSAVQPYASHHFLIGDDNGHYVLYAYTKSISLAPAHLSGMVPLSVLPTNKKALRIIKERAKNFGGDFSDTYLEGLYPIQFFSKIFPEQEAQQLIKEFYVPLTNNHGQVGEELLTLKDVHTPGMSTTDKKLDPTKSQAQFYKGNPDVIAKMFGEMKQAREENILDLNKAGLSTDLVIKEFSPTMSKEEIVEKCKTLKKLQINKELPTQLTAEKKELPPINLDLAHYAVGAYLDTEAAILESLYEFSKTYNRLPNNTCTLVSRNPGDNTQLSLKNMQHELPYNFTSLSALYNFRAWWNKSKGNIINMNHYFLVTEDRTYWEYTDLAYQKSLPQNMKFSDLMHKYFYTSSILYRLDLKTGLIHKMSIGLPNPEMVTTLDKYTESLKLTYSNPDIKLYKVGEGLGYKGTVAD